MNDPTGKESGLPDLTALAAARTRAGDGPDPRAAIRTHTKAFLQCVDARELHRRISGFRGRNFGSMSYKEVAQAILDVIMFDTPNGSMALVQPRSARYPAGTRFYRVRAIPQDDQVTPLRSMSKVGDCWEPPAQKAPTGRLNREGEPLLYTSPINPMVAIDEVKIADGDWCSVIAYDAVDDVNVTVIGADPAVDGLDEADALKLEMIQGFLRDEFTRDVGRGTECLYRISEIIAKDYSDLPPVSHDAWCYPSIADKQLERRVSPEGPPQAAVDRRTGGQTAQTARRGPAAARCAGGDREGRHGRPRLLPDRFPGATPAVPRDHPGWTGRRRRESSVVRVAPSLRGAVAAAGAASVLAPCGLTTATGCARRLARGGRGRRAGPVRLHLAYAFGVCRRGGPAGRL